MLISLLLLLVVVAVIGFILDTFYRRNVAYTKYRWPSHGLLLAVLIAAVIWMFVTGGY